MSTTQQPVDERTAPPAAAPIVDNRIWMPALTLILVNSVASASGFLREVVIAYAFGTSRSADAIAILAFVFDTLSGVIATGLAPYVLVPYAARASRDLSSDEHRVVSTLVTLGVMTVLVLSVGIGWWAPRFVAAVAGETAGPTALLTAKLLRLGALSFPIVALSASLGAVLQARGVFTAPSGSRVVFNVVSAGVLWILASMLGAEATPIALAIGAVAQLVLLLALLHHVQYPLRLRLQFDRRIRELLATAAPALWVFVFVGIVLPSAERLFLSHLAPGRLAAASYAWRFFYLFLTWALAFQAVSFTRLSALDPSAPQAETRHSLLLRDFRVGVFALLPLSIFVWVARDQIVGLALMRGQFDASSLSLTASAFGWYVVFLLPAHCFGAVLRSHIALRESRKAAALAALWALIAVGIDAAALNRMDISAIPFGSGIAWLICALVGLRSLEGKRGPPLLVPVMRYALRIAAIGGLAGTPLLLWRVHSSDVLHRPSMTELLIITAVGAVSGIVYLLLTSRLGLSEIRLGAVLARVRRATFRGA